MLVEAVQVRIRSLRGAFVLIRGLLAGLVFGVAGVGVAVVVGVGSALPAGAQAAQCMQGTGLSASSIQIDSPAVNETVSGTVVVRGSARVSLVGQLGRVEVTLGSVSKAQTFEPGSTLNFNVSLDASSLSTGSTSLKVVACGLLAYGERTINVNVAAPVVPTTVPPATTTTVGGPGTTVVGATSTSVTTASGLPGQAGATTSTRAPTTVTTTPATTVAPAPAATTTTARPGRDTPLVLTETPPKRSSGPPVWVGAVVGISGGLGLLFSARPWRRRTGLPGDRGTGDLTETAEQDLISTR